MNTQNIMLTWHTIHPVQQKHEKHEVRKTPICDPEPPYKC